MTKDELKDCLGTIAQSGTSKFLKALKVQHHTFLSSCAYIYEYGIWLGPKCGSVYMIVSLFFFPNVKMYCSSGKQRPWGGQWFNWSVRCWILLSFSCCREGLRYFLDDFFFLNNFTWNELLLVLYCLRSLFKLTFCQTHIAGCGVHQESKIR